MEETVPKNDFQGAEIIFKRFFVRKPAMVETVLKTIFRVRKSFSRLFCFETKAVVETVPKTIFRVRNSFSRGFLLGNQRHGRNGAKNDFQGAKIIFKRFFVRKPKPW